MTTDWYKDAIIYQVYVRGFQDSIKDGNGDLLGLIDRLDYLDDLGVNCLWLMPIYESPLRDDGYDVSDFRKIHPSIGTVSDFEALTDAAHSRGIRIIADLVISHTSDQHTWFQEARRNPQSPYRDYYVWSDTDDKYREARIIFTDSEPSNWTWDPPRTIRPKLINRRDNHGYRRIPCSSPKANSGELSAVFIQDITLALGILARKRTLDYRSGDPILRHSRIVGES